MFVCPVCQSEYLLYSKLCEDCDRIKKLVSLYGKEKIGNALNRCFLVTEKGYEHKIVKAEAEAKDVTEKKKPLFPTTQLKK